MGTHRFEAPIKPLRRATDIEVKNATNPSNPQCQRHSKRTGVYAYRLIGR